MILNGVFPKLHARILTMVHVCIFGDKPSISRQRSQSGETFQSSYASLMTTNLVAESIILDMQYLLQISFFQLVIRNDDIRNGESFDRIIMFISPYWIDCTTSHEAMQNFQSPRPVNLNINNVSEGPTRQVVNYFTTPDGNRNFILGSNDFTASVTDISTNQSTIQL